MNTDSPTRGGAIPGNGTIEPIENAVIRSCARRRATRPQRLQLRCQGARLTDPLHHASDVLVAQIIDVGAIHLRPFAQSQKRKNFVQRHVRVAAMPAKHQSLGMLRDKAAMSRSMPRWTGVIFILLGLWSIWFVLYVPMVDAV